MTLPNDSKIPDGLCQCGCGLPVTNRYRRGHNNLLSYSLYTVEDRGYKTPCWIWQRQRDKHGYGIAMIKKKTHLVHRDMYEAKFGPIPAGLEPDHLCEVKSCINPDHMEPVTHKVNIRRSKRAILNDDQVAEIKRTARPITLAMSIALGERYGVSARHIRNIIYGSRWRD